MSEGDDPMRRRSKDRPYINPDDLFMESTLLLGQLREAAQQIRDAAADAKQAALLLRNIAEQRIKESGGGEQH